MLSCNPGLRLSRAVPWTGSRLGPCQMRLGCRSQWFAIGMDQGSQTAESHPAGSSIESDATSRLPRSQRASPCVGEPAIGADECATEPC